MGWTFVETYSNYYFDDYLDGERDPELIVTSAVSTNLKSLYIRKGYNKSGIHFELNCTFPFGFFNKYLILRLQYINNLWYFEKITTFNYTRLLDLLSISETLEIK